MEVIDLQTVNDLRSLESAAQSDLPVLSAQNLQPLQNPETASLLPLLLRLSARYRLNRLIQQIHRAFTQWKWDRRQNSHDVKLIVERLFHFFHISVKRINNFVQVSHLFHQRNRSVCCSCSQFQQATLSALCPSRIQSFCRILH